MSDRRLPVLVLVVVLGLLIGFDAASEPTRAPSVPATVPAAPVADDPGVLSSTWFCAAGTAVAEDGAANLTVVAANTSDTPRQLSVTWVPTGGGEPRTDVVDLPALGTVSLKAVEAVEAPQVSAIVEASGGGVIVEHGIVTPRGVALAPCASDASDRWFLANGTTERDATQVLAVFNPFPDDAVVDIAFDTDEGRSEPRGLQGLPVAAGTTTWVRVEDHVRRRAVTAAAIVSRTGRVVVDRIQTFNGELGRTGSSLTLAAPALAETWVFPDGLHQEGLTQQWHVYNPGDETAIVLLDVVPEEGEPPEPMELTVDARRQVIVDPAADELVPAGVAYSSTIRSINGVPVVAERRTDSRSPAPRRGWASELGSPLVADSWGFAIGETSRSTDEYIVVHNPGEVPATFSVLGLGAGQVIQIEGLQDLEVAPAASVRIRLGDHIQRIPLPIVVEADGDVVVERDIFGVGRTGISTTIGIPLP
jgi:hypothetical protein